MEGPYGFKNTIAKAAGLALGTRLNNLREICENQRTISTRKLSQHLDKLEEGMKLDAIHFRELSKKLARHE